MRRSSTVNLLSSTIVVILSLVIVFHLLVFAGIVPQDIVWGGNISSRQEFYVLEAVSIILNLLMIGIVLVYKGKIGLRINRNVIRVLFWLMFALFMLNTLGNLAAKQSLETYIFTPLTFLLAACCLVIGLYGFRKDLERSSGA